MQKFLGISLAFMIAVSVSLTGFSQSQDLKIAYVDILKVFDEYSKTKDYEGRLENKGKQAEKKLDSKKANIEALNNKLSLLKEKERAKEQEKIKEEFLALKELEREIKGDLTKERAEMMKEIFEDVKKVISDYAKKNSYTLVLDKSVIHYGESTLDITKEILKISNQEYKTRKK